MISNYVKTAFRNLWKNKTYGFLNIGGLAIGITCATLIFLWVQSELSFNHMYQKRNDIYQVMNNQTYDGVTYTFTATPGPLAKAMKEEIPGFVRTARMDWGSNTLFSVGDKSIYVRGNYADSSIFPMLNLPVKSGSLKDVFSNIHNIVITESMAEKFFGKEIPVGKKIKMNNDQEYVIKAVLANIPENSSFQFEWVASYDVYFSNNRWLESWGNNGTRTYAEVIPSADVKNINSKLEKFIVSKMEGAISSIFLFNMNQWRLYSNFTNGVQDGGRIRYVKLFTIIAWIILIIACINFMNLATARSEQRAREVGVRKVLGARKRMLISQFISESLFMSFISVILATFLILLFLTPFNLLVEKQLHFSVTNPLHIGSLLLIGLICGLIAGSYPSFYLSSFKPIAVIKGLKFGTNKVGSITRKGLVIIQFSISVVLIISTIVIYKQIQHVKSRDMGYDRNNLIYMSTKGNLKENFEVIRTQLIATGKVAEAALSMSNVVNLNSNSGDYTWQGKDPNKQILITQEDVSAEYIKTTKMKLIEGRDFYPGKSTVDSTNIIVNKTLANIVSKDNAVGSIITSGDNDKYTIIGVVDDMVYNDMYASSAPAIFFNNPSNTGILLIRIKETENISASLNSIEKVLKIYNPGYPFDFKFIDETFNQQFKTEMLTSKLASVFAVLAIFISCLGLFGLAAYTAERRTKEIGIRKVLGASVLNLVGLLSKDFLLLVTLSCLIAFPFAWWSMNSWLSDFTYRISFEWWIFLIAGMTALFIALITISTQAIKAAVSNPVKSLRSE